MNEYPKSTDKMIKDNLNLRISSGIASINNNLNKNVAKIQSDIYSLSAKYKNLRNNLSLTNAKNKRQTEEYIANTGNHTASGFAMSKRMNNDNAFNKEMNNLYTSEQNELSSLKRQIRDAYTDADIEKNKLISEENDKAIERYLSENERKEKLSETKRINDANIRKIDSDIESDKAEDKREQGRYELDMKYGDELKQAEIENIKADTGYTNAKTSTETARKSLVEAQTEKTVNTASGSSSGSPRTKIESGSDMSPANLAENINKQTGNPKYTPEGKLYYEVKPLEAYTMLMAWKKKFGLSDQVVNDTAIYLGIQSYL